MTPNDWQARLALTYAPSSYQAAIFDFVARGQGNIMSLAVAGAGKSTSLVSAVKIAAQSARHVLALAFNVEAKDALTEKLAGTDVRVKTVHGHGYAAIGFTFGWKNVSVDEGKYRDLVDNYIAEFDVSQTLAGDDCSAEENKAIADNGYPRAAILKLIDLARLDLLDAHSREFGSELRRIARHHDVDVDPVLGQLVTDVVRLAMQWGAEHPRRVDFTDMVWLPTVRRLRPWTADWIFVDEAQDISKAHRELIRSSMKRDGRVLFVGDPKQAIYGFAGADADSFEAIIREFECTVLPLSVCYRCPTSVLDLAREIVPQIEARPGAPEGAVRSSSTDAFIDDAQRGDMVLCRLNAPLLSLAFKLIGAGVSAAVRGRDIGKGLAKVIDTCSRGGFARFGMELESWESREKDQARARFGARSEDALAARLEAIEDQAECIRVILSSSGAKSAGALKDAIERLFADGDPAVVLSSVHRAKGLEATRVFIAKPERLGKAWPNSRPWMVEQERNLEYVAYTRAMQELVFLDGAAPEPTGDDADPAGQTSEPEAVAPSVVRTVSAGPAPLAAVDANAPDIYEPADRSARVALARRLDAMLRDIGFEATLDRSSRETIYARDLGGMTCKVYSTIVGQEVRGVGQDSIKVALVCAGRGIGKARRVNRVGRIADIVDRVQQRVTALTK
jgi:DNA helicase-2/ATP-dependent DNA helicase PcrA